MAYVNVADWHKDQVTEWIKGLDNVLLPYCQCFSNNNVNGQQLLGVRSEDLDYIGIKSIGHQELILEAIEHLRHFHFEVDRENLQVLALRLSCQAHSLYNELRHNSSQSLSTQTLADVASVLRALKPLVCWLDRSPFSGQLEYADRKTELLKLGLEIAICAQRDRFAERPVEEIRATCKQLGDLADGIIQDITDPLILQPALLDLTTVRKRVGDDLGIFIVPSFHGIHQIGEIKFGSPAHQCGKIEEGDEVVQVNYQTVVGWQRKKVLALLDEALPDVLLTLKKRPRHSKVYGQIYMKPYRLPSKKRAPAYTRWHENLPSPRPELLTIPDLPRSSRTPPPNHVSQELTIKTAVSSSSESDGEESACDVLIDYEFEGHASPTSMRLYLPKPRVPVQRRATIAGSSPTSHRPPVDLVKIWKELQMEKKWRGSGYSGTSHYGDSRLLRVKSSESTERPSTCLGFEKSQPTASLERIIQNANGKGLNCFSKNLEKNSVNSGSPLHASAETVVQEKQSNNSEKICRESAVVSPSSQESKEKRYITRLDLVVDPQECRIEPVRSRKESLSKTQDDLAPTTPESPFLGEEFEHREKTRKVSACSQLGDLPPSHHRERGRLDKSYSTPAYDLSDIEVSNVDSSKNIHSAKIARKNNSESDAKENNIKTNNCKDSTNTSVLDSSSSILDYSSQSSHEFSTHAVFKFSPPVKKVPNASSTHVSQLENDLSLPRGNDAPDSGSCDSNSNLVLHGRVVETINRHLLDSGHEQEDEDDCGNSWDVKAPSASKEDGHLKNADFDCDTHVIKLDNDFQNGNHKSVQSTSKTDNITFNFDCNQNSPETRCSHKNDETDGKHLKSPGIMIGSSLGDQRVKNESDINPHLESPLSRISPGNFKKQALVTSRQNASVDAQELSSPVKLSPTPPEPPPRPTPPSRSPSTPGDHSKPSTLRAIISGKTSQKTVFSSPKVPRKKNPLLAKRRVVGVKELGTPDYQGWLHRRLRTAAGNTVQWQWNKGWFVLKGTTFYGFKTREAQKAECFISLPGFTTAPAEEVKSKKFAFKVYHTGTVFYFAAESEEELASWLDCVSMATVALDTLAIKSTSSDGAVFSETEDESDEPESSDSCFPSPKMKKLTNFLSGHSSGSGHGWSNTGNPKPAHSHQNLASAGESKSYDIQKKFGSLKKLGYRSRQNNSSPSSPNPATSSSNLSGSELGPEIPSAPHSLDRKYLRFLSSNKSQNVPVPTAQFRSYRRVATPENCVTKEGITTVAKTELSAPSDTASAIGDRSPRVQRSIGAITGELDFRRRGYGSSRSDDMAGLVTLEQFMLLRQEEERQQHHQVYGHHGHDREAAPASESTEAYTGYTEDPVSSLQRSMERRRSPPPTPIQSPAPPPLQPHSGRPIPAARTIVPSGRGTERPAVAPRTLKTVNDSGDQRDAARNKQTNSPTNERSPLTPKQLQLKNAALYQPPPVSFGASPSFGTTFEMHLDQRGTVPNRSEEENQTLRSKGSGSKLRQFFSHHTETTSPTRPGAHGAVPAHQKTLLGSPRLHRALFRHGDSRKPKLMARSDSSGNSLNSPPILNMSGSSSPMSPLSPPDYASDYSSSPKPTMGVSMLGKKPLPLTPPMSNVSVSPAINPPHTPVSPPPDYPGLEYPPVFEPGTYSLSDTSSLLRQSPSSPVRSPVSQQSEGSSSHYYSQR